MDASAGLAALVEAQQHREARVNEIDSVERDAAAGARAASDRLVELDEGAEVTDGGARYCVVRVEQPPHERAFGHAWAELIEQRRPDSEGPPRRARRAPF
jgi:hypothetical protein